MTTTTTYLDDLGRVRVAFSGLSADADYALVERSTDGITWTTVRGGDKVGLTAGAGKLDDYEFAAGVANTYRVTAVDSAAVQPNGAWAFVTANNATLNPPLPTGVVTGAMMLLFVTHANTAATITTPTGWTLLAGGAGHMAVFYRVMAPGVTAPSVAFSGGAAGDSCSAHIRAWTNADAPVHAALQTNASAQDVAYPGATLAQDGIAWVVHEWKKSSASGASAPSLFGDQAGGSNTAGANAETNLTWRTDATVNIRTVTAGTSVYAGGSAAVSKARLLRMTRRVNVGVETSVITPVLDSVWIKNVRRPSLNRKVTVSGISEVSRPARVAIIDVIGRTYPIAINDVRGSQHFTLTVTTPSLAAAADFDNALLTGHAVFIQAPTVLCAIPTVYATIGDTAQRKTSARGVRRYFDLPVTEVAAPASTVYSDTFTIADVVATYATIADVVAAVPTISALIDKVSTAVVIVP
ncbi:hypothetical protein [Amycolatopsis sp. SID8362]|uniref:hypothetical protein n=1 Tax=Amycolatopsis sp. SID8362 TaxID=2690346 RepID=UPI00136D0C3A|nr:hypothetical protein [Amycolatopsis sp. SID8362]NBH01933.1 hypothetical protein [Amycolatopsis sp. SID8362]NED38636.1 hypothetical protein [Amycolatopsis sp. SID8362]